MSGLLDSPTSTTKGRTDVVPCVTPGCHGRVPVPNIRDDQLCYGCGNAPRLRAELDEYLAGQGPSLLVRLNEEQCERCRRKAAKVQAAARDGGQVSVFVPFDDADVHMHKEYVGACGEMAVSVFTGLKLNEKVIAKWKPDTPKPVDVGQNVEVRATEFYAPYKGMPVYKNDPAHRYVTWVTGVPPMMLIRGWLRARDARVVAFMSTGKYASTSKWEVPLEYLLPMADLPADA